MKGLARAVAVIAGALAVAAPAPAAFAARSGDVLTDSSVNWAGYVVAARPFSPPLRFTSVSGAWKQPAVTCTPGAPSAAALWVGLGGSTASSKALEQTGTAADCSETGRATYSIWYELVPAAPVTTRLPLKPGDGIAASVAVSGKRVSIRITNVTRGKRTFAKQVTMAAPAPDVSSAEWIAEAPSVCDPLGACSVLPLADFGGAMFVVAKAAEAGHAGTIGDPAWTATAVSLVAGDAGDPPVIAAGEDGGATPSPLTSDGSSFGVTWSAVVERRLTASVSGGQQVARGSASGQLERAPVATTCTSVRRQCR
jgi:hypothetical protein